MKFLIADDNHESRRIIQLFLKPHGVSVTAANGKEAVDCFVKALDEDSAFDVVYLDNIMPELSGLEAVAAIRKVEGERGITKPVPIFMLTGETDASVINMARANGVIEYLLKPIQEERLIQGLERLELINTDDTW